jgi:HEPN domain-containing protein
MRKSKGKYEEWFFQADYDYETAEVMFSSGRYVYAIFMCHLALEKILKGLFIKKLDETPLKNHNLLYFIEILRIKLSEEQLKFLFSLNKASIPTRYPDDLRALFKVYTKTKTKEILNNTKDLMIWLKQI